jgi:hypothetical protein
LCRFPHLQNANNKASSIRWEGHLTLYVSHTAHHAE